MRQHSSVEVQCIGAGATNQAIKAIAIARAYLRDDHIDVGCVPFFIDVAIDGEDRTALRLVVERYPNEAVAV
jgi:stage V sporulation protein S